MIPRDYVLEWRRQAPWTENFQVEQDLIISRALVEIFSDPLLASNLAIRGGTALNKLYLTPAARYSEDIDLVQIEPRAAGSLMAQLRDVFRPWLGEASWRQSHGRVTLLFRFLSEDVPAMRLRLKLEINSREHFAVLGLAKRRFIVDSRWFTGSANIVSFELDELLATKLRALYQRRKGRDLFDLAIGLNDEHSNARRIASVFQQYMDREGSSVTRSDFERNLADKLNHPGFNADMNSLARLDVEWSIDKAARRVLSELISLIPIRAT